ncbi:hypothetical protein GJ496_008218 [Pomphorhynchus laevis]|nr:hypothetical protein GJ496_008218 [Pomphorhynchus laevis]
MTDPDAETFPLLGSTYEYDGRYRWVALFLMCLASLGSSYCYHNPAALQDVLMRDLKITSSTFTSFYSWYSWPNVVLCLFGGILTDRLGRRSSICLFSSLVLCGQLTFALGAMFAKVWLMQLGRIIFGIGGESLGTVINTFLASWFFSRELNFAFGFRVSFARVFSSINMYLTRPLFISLNPYFSASHQIGMTYLILVLVCLTSLLAAIALCLLDKHRVGNNPQLLNSQNVSISSLKNVVKLPGHLYLVSLICLCYYVSIFPFIAVGVKFFQLRYGLSAQFAGFIDSCILMSSAIVAPIIGAAVDKVGRNLLFITLSIIGTFIAHAMMAFSFIHPLVAMIIFGFSFSFMSAFFWPIIVIIVPQSKIGTAYGLMFAMQNLGMALMNMSSGYIIDYRGYFSLQITMMTLVLYALMFNLQLVNLDKRKGGCLNLSVKQRISALKATPSCT